MPMKTQVYVCCCFFGYWSDFMFDTFCVEQVGKTRAHERLFKFNFNGAEYC